MKFSAALARFVCSFILAQNLLLWTSSGLYADTWRGTAPFCKGRCLSGETEIARNKNGNGGHCVTGSKALCRNAAALCRPTQTKTSCAGVVMICDAGFYSIPDVWHSCSKFACGACFGL